MKRIRARGFAVIYFLISLLFGSQTLAPPPINFTVDRVEVDGKIYEVKYHNNQLDITEMKRDYFPYHIDYSHDHSILPPMTWWHGLGCLMPFISVCFVLISLAVFVYHFFVKNP